MDDIVFSRQLPGIFAQEALRLGDYPMANRHFHEYLELYFMLEGERYYFVEQDTYRIAPRTAILVNSSQIHKTSKVNSHAEHHRFLLHLEPSVIDSQFSMKDFPSVKDIGNNYWGIAEFSPEDWQMVLQLIEMMKTEMKRYSIEAGHMSVLFVMQLIALFVQNRKDQEISGGSSPASVYSIRTGIHQKVHEIALHLQNHCGEPCTLEEISQQFQISIPYLTRIFKSVTSFSVMEYRNICRIRKAKTLLCDTDLSVTEIASRCGFGNITYFEKIFKRMTEYSPLQFRKSEDSFPDSDRAGI